jgi:Rap1a immunity proteins
MAPGQLFSGELLSGRSVAGRNGETTKLKFMVRGIMAAMMITTAAVAEEEVENAGFLLPYCKVAPAQAASKAFLVGRCVGLVQGIADALGLLKDASGERLNPLCVERPKGTSTDQAVKVVVKYGDAHPEQSHAPFTVVAALALTEAWPCKK